MATPATLFGIVPLYRAGVRQPPALEETMADNQFVIVNQSSIPTDQRTRQIIIRALEVAEAVATGKEASEYRAVLLAMKATQTTMPF